MNSTLQSTHSGHWLSQFHIPGTIALAVLFGISSVSNLFSQESQAGGAVVTAKKIPNRSAGSYFNELRGTGALPLNGTENSSTAESVPPVTLSVPPLATSFGDILSRFRF